MIRIGLGILTCNRSQNLAELINSIRRNTSIPYNLFCAVDGSTDDSDSFLKSEEIEYCYGPNVGPEQNKNRIFRRFSQYNYIIIIEDDMLITHPKWLDTLLLGHTLTNYDYMGFLPSDNERYAEYNASNIGDIEISYIDKYIPKVNFYTRKLIEKVGGIDERIKGYVSGVSEHYNRITQCGLLPSVGRGIVNIKSLDNMIIENPKKIKLNKDYSKSYINTDIINNERIIFKKL